jgi:hypothetical protein
VNHTAWLVEFRLIERVSREQPEDKDRGPQQPKASRAGCIAFIGRQSLDEARALEDSEEPQQSQEAQRPNCREAGDKVNPVISQIPPRTQVVQAAKQELQEEESRQAPNHIISSVPPPRNLEETESDIGDGQNAKHYVPFLTMVADEPTQPLA